MSLNLQLLKFVCRVLQSQTRPSTHQNSLCLLSNLIHLLLSSSTCNSQLQHLQPASTNQSSASQIRFFKMIVPNNCSLLVSILAILSISISQINAQDPGDTVTYTRACVTSIQSHSHTQRETGLTFLPLSPLYYIYSPTISYSSPFPPLSSQWNRLSGSD